MQVLGYPLAVEDRIPEITEARNIELGLGLQVISLVFFICYGHVYKLMVHLLIIKA